MAELWEVLSSKMYEPISEKEFLILEKLYVSSFQGSQPSNEIDPSDLDALLECFNSFVNHPASEASWERPGGKASRSDNEFLHFAVACKYYLPLLNSNPMVRFSHQDRPIFRPEVC